MKVWMQLNRLELEQIGNFNFPLNKTNKHHVCRLERGKNMSFSSKGIFIQLRQ